MVRVVKVQEAAEAGRGGGRGLVVDRAVFRGCRRVKEMRDGRLNGREAELVRKGKELGHLERAE